MLSGIPVKVSLVSLAVAVLLLGVQTYRVQGLKAGMSALEVRYNQAVEDNRRLAGAVEICHETSMKQLQAADEELKRKDTLSAILCSVPDIEYTPQTKTLELNTANSPALVVEVSITKKQSDALIVYWNDVFKPL